MIFDIPWAPVGFSSPFVNWVGDERAEAKYRVFLYTVDFKRSLKFWENMIKH